MIYTIKDLKETIKNLPDDMLVKSYVGGNGDLVSVSGYTRTIDDFTPEEIEGYKIEGKEIIPTFIINAD